MEAFLVYIIYSVKIVEFSLIFIILRCLSKIDVKIHLKILFSQKFLKFKYFFRLKCLSSSVGISLVKENTLIPFARNSRIKLLKTRSRRITNFFPNFISNSKICSVFPFFPYRRNFSLTHSTKTCRLQGDYKI